MLGHLSASLSGCSSKTNGVWLPAQIHPHLLLWAKPPFPPQHQFNVFCLSLTTIQDKKLFPLSKIFQKYPLPLLPAMWMKELDQKDQWCKGKFLNMLAESPQFGNLVKKFHISDSGRKSPLQRELWTNLLSPLPDNLILGLTPLPPPCRPSQSHHLPHQHHPIHPSTRRPHRQKKEQKLKSNVIG